MPKAYEVSYQLSALLENDNVISPLWPQDLVQPRQDLPYQLLLQSQHSRTKSHILG
jgi:hypothetical protein